MALGDILDGFEILTRLAGFWGFLAKPSYRAQVLADWRAASPGKRASMVLESTVTLAVVIGIPVIVLWLILT